MGLGIFVVVLTRGQEALDLDVVELSDFLVLLLRWFRLTLVAQHECEDKLDDAKESVDSKDKPMSMCSCPIIQ